MFCSTSERCSICLSKLKKWHVVEELWCKHRLHRKCYLAIILGGKAFCPLCRHPILNEEEKQFVLDPFQFQTFPSNADPVKLLTVFNTSTSYNLHMKELVKLVDFTDVLIQHRDDIELIDSLSSNNVKINWFKSFGGKTFYDLVKSSKNPRFVSSITRLMENNGSYRVVRTPKPTKNFTIPSVNSFFPRYLSDEMLPSAPSISDLNEKK